ncbi:MAG: hypothetical protein JXR34_13270 [Bacteroidales bacterium]|nr:hypothetical protein [Bacteroidales bacterium]
MLKFLKIFLAFLLVLFFLPFIISPTYDFPEPNPFRGEKIWNPYQDMTPENWRRCNFQVQSRAWAGVTDGRNNTFDKVWTTYHELGYDIIGISDYQKINTLAKDSTGFIPIYEHGYNIRKTHQVNIGADKVLWLDFMFYQTTSHKQFIINLLRQHTKVLALAHPAFSLEGYSHEDAAKLTNYDLFEALNMQIYSLSHWDAALSAGHISYILANDDVHDIDDPFWYGRVMTVVNAKDISAEDIYTSLLSGNSYGFSPYTPDFDTQEKKIKRFKNLPMLQKVSVEGERLTIVADSGVAEIRFIGQGGKIRKTVKNATLAYYDFTEEDSYIRTEIDYDRDEVMFLNPVFRYSGEAPKRPEIAKINWVKTILFNLLAFSIFSLLMILIFRRWK